MLRKKHFVSTQWLRDVKHKKYPFWRLDTFFSKYKFSSIRYIKNGGWHFTNIKSAKDIHTKLSNFGHHNEFDVSGITVEDIQECIDKKIVNYNHKADKTEKNKYNANYKLQVIEDKLLPSYIINNKLAYASDINEIYQKDLNHFKNLKYLVIDCLRIKKHPSHFNLDDILKLNYLIKPKKTILTNMHSDLDYNRLLKILPKNIKPGFDGLTLNI